MGQLHYRLCLLIYATTVLEVMQILYFKISKNFKWLKTILHSSKLFVLFKEDYPPRVKLSNITIHVTDN